MPQIHPSAFVDESATLAEDVTVEAGATVEAGCSIGAGTQIGKCSIIWAGTAIGARNRIFPFCSLGGEPQDKKYAGEDAPLIIGDDNLIREYCFFSKGTAASGKTRIGDRNWIMGYVHVAHDCVLGDDITISNAVQLAGHVIIGDHAVIGGGSLVHQFRQIGAGAMVGGGEKIRMDILPWLTVANDSVIVNAIGMRRKGYNEEQIAAAKQAQRILFRQHLTLAEAAAEISALPNADAEPLSLLLEFIALPDIKILRPR